MSDFSGLLAPAIKICLESLYKASVAFRVIVDFAGILPPLSVSDRARSLSLKGIEKETLRKIVSKVSIYIETPGLYHLSIIF